MADSTMTREERESPPRRAGRTTPGLLSALSVAPPRWLRGLALAVVTLTYAVCFIAIKVGLPYAPPLRFAGLRVLTGAIVLLGVIVALRRPLLPRTGWPGLLALAFTATTLSFGAMFLAGSQTGAGIASVLGNTQPLVAIVLARVVLGETITWAKAVALTLGLSGVTLIAAPALGSTSPTDASGALLALTVSLGSASGSVIAKRLGAAFDSLPVTAWQLALGSLPLLVGSAIVERDAAIEWSVTFFGVLLFLSVVGTSIAVALWFWLVQHEDVGRLTMFLFLVPVAGLGLSAAVLGETITPLAGIGLLLALIGVATASWEAWQSEGRPSASGQT